MVDGILVPRSPLVEPLPSLDGASLRERRLDALVQLASWPDTRNAIDAALGREGLPPVPASGRSCTVPSAIVMNIGPGRVLVDTRRSVAEALIASVPSDMGTATDLSHARICLELSGTRAVWILSKGITFDLDLAAFPAGAVAITEIAHIGIVLHRISGDAFGLYPYRGYAVSLAEWLRVAGTDETLPVG